MVAGGGLSGGAGALGIQFQVRQLQEAAAVVEQIDVVVTQSDTDSGAGGGRRHGSTPACTQRWFRHGTTPQVVEVQVQQVTGGSGVVVIRYKYQG